MHSLAEATVGTSQIGIHWFEQSSYALRAADGTTLLVDPYFPRTRPAEKFVHTEPPHDEAALRPDAVLLTHDHSDHTCPESLARLHAAFPDVRYIGPAESAARIAAETEIPAAQVEVIAAGDRVQVGGFTVHVVYAKAPEGDPANDIAPPDVTHLGFVLQSAGPAVYVSGDVFNTFAQRDDLVRAVAALRPEIGFLTCHPTEGEFPFFEGSVRMAARIGLRYAVPAHYACFAKRDYDPAAWAEGFKSLPVEPLVIPRNSTVVLPRD